MKTTFLILILLLPLGVVLPARAGEASAPLEPGQILDTLRSRERSLDPFGLSMNPAIAAPAFVEAPVETPRPPRSTLREAMRGFTVTGVNLKRKSVMIGPRSLAAGDQLHFESRGIDFRLRLLDVTLRDMKVEDLDTGETLLIPLNLLPDIRSAAPRTGSTIFQKPRSPLRIVRGGDSSK